MKRTIFTLAALLITWLFASAQFNFGIKGGYNSSLNLENISTVQSGTYDLNRVAGELKNGFHGGVFIRVGGKIYVQPELLYGLQKKNFQLTILDATNPSLPIDKFVTFSTIDVPVLIGYKLVDGKIFNIRAFAGPKFKLNAGSKFSFENIQNLDEQTLKNDLGGEFKNASVGLELGAGVDLFMFTLDARLNVINDVYSFTKDTKPDLTSNFVVSLGWKF